MAGRKLWARGWRAAVMIALGAALGATLVTPAVAHIGGWAHNWKDHIKPRVRVYGDDRWVNGAEQAYGYVQRDPAVALDPSRTKNFTGVTNPMAGVYCLTPVAGINPDSRTAIVSPEWGNSGGAELEAFFYADGADCAAGEFEVITSVAGVLSNNVAFSIFVP
jgi:hypothetical protein